MTGTPWIARPTWSDLETVRVLAPLAAELTIRCGPFDVPAAVTASSPTLEQERSEEARLLRDFLDDDPFGGMGPARPGGWMLLARDDDCVVLGQREGRVGLGSVVELALRDGAFRARRSGGWHLRTPNADERVEACFAARVEGTTVTVDWMNEQDPAGAPGRVDPTVELSEGSDDVHVLLRTARADPQPSDATWTSGTGLADTATFELSAPLGRRRLLSDHGIPPVVLTVLTGRRTRSARRRPA